MGTESDCGADAKTSEFLWEVHRYTNEYIRFADTKAVFIAGASTALIGSLVASSIFDSCFRTPLCSWTKLQWMGVVGLVLLAISLGLSIAAIRPRLWNKTSVGFIYWGSITGHGTAQHFAQEARVMSDRDKAVAIAYHLYMLATIAKRKYSYVDKALIIGLLGGVSTGIILFVLHARR